MKNKLFKFLFLLIICFSLCTCYVFAEEIDTEDAYSSDINFFNVTNYYGCGNSSTKNNSGVGGLSGEECSASVSGAGVDKNGYTSTVYLNNSTSTKQEQQAVSYSIVVMIDKSGSMDSSKIKQAKESLKEIKTSIDKAEFGSNTKVKVCTYKSNYKCSSWYKGKEIANLELPSKNPSGGATFTQVALNNAYKILESDVKKSQNVPMVILISDGYHSKYSKTITVEKDSGNDKLYLSYRYFYYTTQTLINLKKNLIKLKNDHSKYQKAHAKLYTITTTGKETGNKYDELVDFSMNPTQDTYNELKGFYGENNYRSSEAATLKNFIDGKSVIENDAVSSVKGDRYKAIYRGVGKDGEHIDYKFTNLSNLKLWSKWLEKDAHPLMFHLPFDSGTGENLKNVSSIKVFLYKKNGDKIGKFSCNKTKYPSNDVCGYSVVQDNGTGNWSFQIYRSGVFSKYKDDIAKFLVRVYVDKSVKFKTVSTTKWTKDKFNAYDSKVKENTSIVDYHAMASNSTKLKQALQSIFSKSFSKVYVSKGEKESSEYTRTLDANDADFCVEEEKALDDVSGYYYCLPDKFVFVNSSGNHELKNPLFYGSSDGAKGKIGQCVPVDSIKVQYAVRERSSIQLGPFSKVKYPGSGFTTSGGILTNNVSWDFVDKSKKNILKVNLLNGYYIFGGSEFVSDETKPIKIQNLSFVSLDDIYTCKNGGKSNYRNSCNKVSFDVDGNITKNVEESVVNNINSNNIQIANDLSESAIYSFDSNFYDSNKSYVASDLTSFVPVSTDVTFSIVKDIGNKFISSFNFNFRKSCIYTVDSEKHGEVYYTKKDLIKEENVNAESSNDEMLNGECPKNSIEQVKRQYFIPLKWPIGKEFLIMVNPASNLSSYNGIEIGYEGSCGVDITGPGLYDGDKVNYYYRSIDIENPFPGGKKGKNWETWYSDDNQLNISRISDSFKNIYYSIKFNSDVSWKDNYLLWTNMNVDGSSKFVVDEDSFFETVAPAKSYCPIGEFNAEVCDKVGD